MTQPFAPSPALDLALLDERIGLLAESDHWRNFNKEILTAMFATARLSEGTPAHGCARTDFALGLVVSLRLLSPDNPVSIPGVPHVRDWKTAAATLFAEEVERARRGRPEAPLRELVQAAQAHWSTHLNQLIDISNRWPS